MARATPPTGRQRPGGSSGPARDAARDVRIVEAVLDLIVEHGYADLTMAAVATRAQVAKATVYRRWASREDLVADALESLMIPAAPERAPAATLRDDLVAALAHSSACLQPDRRRFFAVLARVTPTHHEVMDTLRARYLAAQRDAIVACLHRARERGEITAERLDLLTGPDRLEVSSAVAVLMLQEELVGELLGLDGITRLVDQIILPLVREPASG